MRQSFILLFLLIHYLTFAQINEIPCSNKIFLEESQIIFESPDSDYSQIDALRHEEEIKELYNLKDKKIKGIQTYYNELRVWTEGYSDAISKIPFVSPLIAIGKEKLYQEAENAIDLKTNKFKQDFDKKVEALFVADLQQMIKNKNSISFNEAIVNFENTVQAFDKALDKKDYQIVASTVDKVIIKLIKENREYFKNKFEEQKNNLTSIQREETSSLKANFDLQIKALQSSVINFDKELLSKIKDNSNSLVHFNNEVSKKFSQLQDDIRKMKSEIEDNKTIIKSNTERIKANKEDITVLKKLQIENSELISENSYKIDVISGVLYENASTNGKIKLLDLKFKENPKNAEYKEKKKTLENIQAVEEINNYLKGAQEITTLAKHLDLDPETLKKANQAIKVGEVIANGAMAYFTGNPVAGLQAVNGALSLFGGSNNENPEFNAIMAEFAQINEKLDLINERLDLISDNIYELKKINIDIFKENQKRFTNIDEKLVDIEVGVNNITQLIYSDKSAELEVQNASQWHHLWEQIDNTSSLDTLKTIYDENKVVQDLIGIVYTNTQTKTSDKKTFLHFDGKDFDKYWQNEIFTPILNFHNSINKTYDYKNLEYPVVGIYEYDRLIKLEKVKLDKEIFEPLDYKDLPKLLHPQSIITLSHYLALFEPYFYFYSSNNFNIAENINNLNYNNKNKHLKIQFQNLHKENRQAIIQTNLISGVSLLKFFKKHIVDRKNMSFDDKKQVYELLQTNNNYLKLNLSNHIINSGIIQKSMLIKFKELEESKTISEADKIAESINLNQSFEDKSFKLIIKGNEKDFKAYLLIKPYGQNPDDFTNQKILLPIPPFEYLYEKKMAYPEYLQALILNQEFLINKIIKYDIPLRIKDSPKYKNFQLLN